MSAPELVGFDRFSLVVNVYTHTHLVNEQPYTDIYQSIYLANYLSPYRYISISSYLYIYIYIYIRLYIHTSSQTRAIIIIGNENQTLHSSQSYKKQQDNPSKKKHSMTRNEHTRLRQIRSVLCGRSLDSCTGYVGFALVSQKTSKAPVIVCQTLGRGPHSRAQIRGSG